MPRSLHGCGTWSASPEPVVRRPRVRARTPLLADDSGYNPRTTAAVTLTSGTQLGPYEVTALLGAGGMGEVYRARDTRPALAREVAIKVLAGTREAAAPLSRRPGALPGMLLARPSCVQAGSAGISRALIP